MGIPTSPPYSPDLAPSDYHLFRSMAHGLADQHFRSYEEVKNWIDSWITSKDESFSNAGFGLSLPHFALHWTLDTILEPNLRSNRVQSMYRNPRGFHTPLQETANQEKGFSRRYLPRCFPRVYRIASVQHDEDMRIF
ncbi:mariner Mos1 transposase [Trichonephila clavipes]|nr:mariner Mos1 transposase [Trichonephila clavipes]